MKNFIIAFFLVYVATWFCLFFSGLICGGNPFANLWVLLAFVSLIITSLGTLFYKLFIRIEDLEARVKLLEEKLDVEQKNES